MLDGAAAGCIVHERLLPCDRRPARAATLAKTEQLSLQASRGPTIHARKCIRHPAANLRVAPGARLATLAGARRPARASIYRYEMLCGHRASVFRSLTAMGEDGCRSGNFEK